MAKKEAADGPIRVVAKRAGFYRGQRIKAGVTFTIRSAKELGSWMKPAPGATDQLAQRLVPRPVAGQGSGRRRSSTADPATVPGSGDPEAYAAAMAAQGEPVGEPSVDTGADAGGAAGDSLSVL